MTCIRSKSVKALAISAVVAASLTSTASADCLRRVYNRSTAVLVASQDGGPAFVVPPGRSATVRLSRPGQIDLTAYCSPVDRIGRPVAGGREAAKLHLDYEAVLDRCFMKFGDGFFQPELGPGFFGTTNTAPFTVNNPKQGDVVLGPSGAICSPEN
ncbi:hypothetical protein [Methylobacterium sp. WL103]|uniref:hypothetical protein n=1 Tax=Methylobacterium sp. WL103 TaxID=2603891 RepID=UPI00164F3903|nr:hypothetical protein [Methylobacterium sp. WL103]